MGDPTKGKVTNIEDYPVFKEYEDVFGEFPGLPLKRDIKFSIDLMHVISLVSKTPYIMSTP